MIYGECVKDHQSYVPLITLFFLDILLQRT